MSTITVLREARLFMEPTIWSSLALLTVRWLWALSGWLLEGDIRPTLLPVCSRTDFYGSLGTNFPDRPPPTRLFGQATVELESTMSAGKNFGPGAPRMFANGKHHSEHTLNVI